MATTTLDNIVLGGEAGSTEMRSGLLSRLLEGLIASREAEARRLIALHAARLPDEHFVHAGFSAREIEELRKAGRISANAAG